MVLFIHQAVGSVAPFQEIIQDVQRNDYSAKVHSRPGVPQRFPIPAWIGFELSRANRAGGGRPLSTSEVDNQGWDYKRHTCSPIISLWSHGELLDDRTGGQGPCSAVAKADEIGLRRGERHIPGRIFSRFHGELDKYIFRLYSNDPLPLNPPRP